MLWRYPHGYRVLTTKGRQGFASETGHQLAGLKLAQNAADHIQSEVGQSLRQTGQIPVHLVGGIHQDLVCRLDAGALAFSVALSAGGIDLRLCTGQQSIRFLSGLLEKRVAIHPLGGLSLPKNGLGRLTGQFAQEAFLTVA